MCEQRKQRLLKTDADVIGTGGPFFACADDDIVLVWTGKNMDYYYTSQSKPLRPCFIREIPAAARTAEKSLVDIFGKPLLLLKLPEKLEFREMLSSSKELVVVLERVRCDRRLGDRGGLGYCTEGCMIDPGDDQTR